MPCPEIGLAAVFFGHIVSSPTIRLYLGSSNQDVRFVAAAEFALACGAAGIVGQPKQLFPIT